MVMSPAPEPRLLGLKILVVEDSATQLLRLAHLLGNAGCTVFTAKDGAEGLEVARACMPDLVVTDIVMPGMDGWGLSRALRADGLLADIPIVALTALTDPSEVLRGVECGANAFVSKPCEDEFLLSSIVGAWANHLLRAEQSADRGFSIIFDGQERGIQGDPRRVLELLLSTYKSAVRQNAKLVLTRDELRDSTEKLEQRVLDRTAELSAEVALREVSDARFRTILELNADGILVVDDQGVVQSANRAAHLILGRSTEGLVGRPFGVALVRGEGSEIEVVRENGDGAVIEMHVVDVQLDEDSCCIVSLRDISEHKKQAEKFRQLSVLDELTGLLNRRGLAQRIEQQMVLCTRQGGEFVLAYLDLDDFKDINDLYGHEEGDLALIAMSQIMVSGCRASDVVARVGGDEFVALAIDAKREDSDSVVARLQGGIDRWNAVSGSPYRLSVSIGVAVYDPKEPRTPADLLNAADDSMYKGKGKKAGNTGLKRTVSARLPGRDREETTG